MGAFGDNPPLTGLRLSLISWPASKEITSVKALCKEVWSKGRALLFFLPSVDHGRLIPSALR